MSEQLDKAFEALKTYDWGVDPEVIKPIDEEIVTTHSDAAARKDLETRLIAVLKTEAPRAAKDALCRALKTVGTAAAVPALAALLPDEKLSHMGRYALERIPDPEAAQALREALAKVTGKLKVGVISSIGVRGDSLAIPSLQALLADADATVALAAGRALCDIGTADAHKALVAAKPSPATKAAVAESELACAQALFAAGRKGDAKTVYERLLKQSPPKPAKTAAELGLKACGAP